MFEHSFRQGVDYLENPIYRNHPNGIAGVKCKARMDISADRINNKWNYSKIKIRIKNPPEKKQTIEIKTRE
jgi:hypothetical protein